MYQQWYAYHLLRTTAPVCRYYVAAVQLMKWLFLHVFYCNFRLNFMTTSGRGHGPCLWSSVVDTHDLIQPLNTNPVLSHLEWTKRHSPDPSLTLWCHRHCFSLISSVTNDTSGSSHGRHSITVTLMQTAGGPTGLRETPEVKASAGTDQAAGLYQEQFICVRFSDRRLVFPPCFSPASLRSTIAHY